jgi:hypothetical protein
MAFSVSSRSSDLVLDKLTAKYEPILAREVVRAMRKAARQYSEILGDTDWEQEHRERIGAILLDLWTESGHSYAKMLQTDAKSAGYSMERKDLLEIFKPRFISGLIADWVAQWGGSRITAISDTTKEDINAIIAQAEIDGLPERQVTRLIQEVAPNKAAYRAQAIARTEAHGVGQSTSLSLAKQSDIQMVKVWIANENDFNRTRQAHRDAHNQKVPLDAKFEVGGELLEYPGDPSGSASNTISCRCVVGYDVVTPD